MAGIKVGTAIGVTRGIGTDLGAVITGLVGSIIFGAAGYFGANFIYEN